MTSIHQALRHQLECLYQLLGQLDDRVLATPSHMLSQSTIGQHMRHVIELLQCLESGYHAGLVNYDNRKRDRQIETDRNYAMSAIDSLIATVFLPDKDILLEGCYQAGEELPTIVSSTYNRELVYNIEHAVHHMALIKVGLKEQGVNVVDEEFGVASATIQYRKLCAQ